MLLYLGGGRKTGGVAPVGFIKVWSIASSHHGHLLVMSLFALHYFLGDILNPLEKANLQSILTVIDL